MRGWAGGTTHACLVNSGLSVWYSLCLDLELNYFSTSGPCLIVGVMKVLRVMWFFDFDFLKFGYPGVSVHTQQNTQTHTSLLPIYEVIHEVLKGDGSAIRGEISVCAWVTPWKRLQLIVWSSKLGLLVTLLGWNVCLEAVIDTIILPNCSNDSQPQLGSKTGKW